MKRTSKAALERALADHFGSAPNRPAALAPPTLIAAVRAEATAERGHTRAWDFVRGQVRYVRPLTWVGVVVCTACALLAAAISPSKDTAALTAGLAGTGCALAVLPELVRARANGMWELESACAHNAAAVAFARTLVTGAAAALALLCVSVACAREAPFWTSLSHTLAPFLTAAAGGLMTARRARSADALWAATSWVVVTGAATVALCTLDYPAFALVADGIWAAGAAAAALWCSLELRQWLLAAVEPTMTARNFSPALDLF